MDLNQLAPASAHDNGSKPITLWLGGIIVHSAAGPATSSIAPQLA